MWAQLWDIIVQKSFETYDIDDVAENDPSPLGNLMEVSQSLP